MLDLLEAFLSIDFPVIYSLRIIVGGVAVVIVSLNHGELELIDAVIAIYGFVFFTALYWTISGAFAKRTHLRIQQDMLLVSNRSAHLNRRSVTIRFDWIYTKIKIAAIFNLTAPIIAPIFLINYFGDGSLAGIALLWMAGFIASEYVVQLLVFGRSGNRPAIFQLSKGLKNAANFEFGTFILGLFLGLTEIGGRAFDVY